MSLRGLILTVTALCFACQAHAATSTGLDFGKSASKGPIKVTADQFLADMNSKTGTYSGNVLVTQGDFKLRADRVKVLVVNNKPDKIQAFGNVVFNAPSGNAQGDNGVYDVNPRVISLAGHVILTKDKNVMRGTTLTVNLATGEARLGAKGEAGGRVQGLFTPAPEKASSSSPPPP